MRAKGKSARNCSCTDVRSREGLVAGRETVASMQWSEENERGVKASGAVVVEQLATRCLIS